MFLALVKHLLSYFLFIVSTNFGIKHIKRKRIPQIIPYSLRTDTTLQVNPSHGIFIIKSYIIMQYIQYKKLHILNVKKPSTVNFSCSFLSL